jgi:hypothetical protein
MPTQKYKYAHPSLTLCYIAMVLFLVTSLISLNIDVITHTPVAGALAIAAIAAVCILGVLALVIAAVRK